MKTINRVERRWRAPCWLAVAATFCAPALPPSAEAQTATDLRIRSSRQEVELVWPAWVDTPNGRIVPIFELQASRDLGQWSPVGERVVGPADDFDGFLRQALPALDRHGFFRVVWFPPRTGAALASGGGEAFGFDDLLAAELERIGQITPAEFAERYAPEAPAVGRLGWDPTTARYWDRFNTDIGAHNRGKSEDDLEYRHTDFRLNGAELDLFRRNGFVVSERLGASDFATVYYRLWKDDLPVFISTDAILQAWHRSFDMMLIELEETFLSEGLGRMLAAMAAELPGVAVEAGDGPLAESVRDADWYLAVARSLLSGRNVPPVLDGGRRVAETLERVRQAKMVEVPDLFGVCRTVDFSQFTPRGHYTASEELRRYFQAMMWCGRIDIPVAGPSVSRCADDPLEAVSLRETGVALALWRLLEASGEFETWRSVDRTIGAFVGWTDSMTFAQLGSLLRAAGIRTLAEVPDAAALEGLQAALLEGELGVQHIRSDFFVSPLGPDRIRLPRTFTVLGQRFVPDSWALASLVYDSVWWDEDGVPTEEDKVRRRVPSALDVAFAVLANDQVVPDLTARLTDTTARESTDHAVRYRDGLNYQHNLAAVREVVERMESAVWADSLYMEWLATLRELSAPTADAVYPEAMRTRAWAMKTLNTQLASWTQLRHDAVLYVKPSYTGFGRCSFPAGYVEPQPAFWARLERMARAARDWIGRLAFDGGSSRVQDNQVEFLRRFARTVNTLRILAGKELAGVPFGREEELFIRNLLEYAGLEGAGGSGSARSYDGWYPQLFYRPLNPGEGFHEAKGCGRADLLVADIHTDVPCPAHGDPGSVLHEGVGDVNLLMIAVETGAEPTVFAGPVLSHYEFELVGPPRRLTDEEWKAWAHEDWGRPTDAPFPDPPPWTGDYLVPDRTP